MAALPVQAIVQLQHCPQIARNPVFYPSARPVMKDDTYIDMDKLREEVAAARAAEVHRLFGLLKAWIFQRSASAKRA